MKASVLRQWGVALRSGKYKQGIGGLKFKIENEHKYCCLGVLCDLSDGSWRAKTIGERTEYSMNGDDNGYQLKNNKTARPLRGIKSSVRIELARMNDRGFSFKAIADWIEGNAKKFI